MRYLIELGRTRLATTVCFPTRVARSPVKAYRPACYLNSKSLIFAAAWTNAVDAQTAV